MERGGGEGWKGVHSEGEMKKRVVKEMERKKVK